MAGNRKNIFIREVGVIMKAKSKVNFIIDAIMFLNMMALAGTGFLNRFVLLSGKAARSVYGQKVQMTMLGLGKESWKDIHLYLGFLLLGLLVLHIVLHWQQIVLLYRRLIDTDKMRKVLLVVFVIVSILLVTFPFIFSPVVETGETLYQGRGRGF